MISGNINQTKKIAKGLARKVLKLKNRKTAVVIGLMGELGSGKTTFCQSFAKALGVKERIHSPTFVLMKKYPVTSSQYLALIHIDAYRIRKTKEIIDLGWKELIKNLQNIIIIEWADKIKKIMPEKYIKINFKHKDKNKRWIKIKKI